MNQIDHNASLLADYRKYMLPVLNFRDIVLVRGQGSYVWDANGARYLDLNSGQFCAVLGHSDPGVSKMMIEISQTLQDTDTSTLTEAVLQAAKKIHDRARGMQARTIFLSTGAEAVECCLKYAKHLKEKSGVISFDKAYHGLTHGSAAYSMSRDRIRPTVEHSYVTPTPRVFSGDDSAEDRAEIDHCIEVFRQTIAREKAHIAAAIFEPIVSGGGFYFPPARYFQAIREICDDNDIFLIFDECQTGFGRTGSWFYYQQLDCVPDFIVCAKAMGMGYPVSCVIANGRTVPHEKFVMEYFSSHQNESYAGALVSHLIDEIEARDLLNANRVTGEALRTRLGEIAAAFPSIRNVRGRGLMCAFDLAVTPGLDSKQAGDLFCALAQRNGLLMQHCNMGRTLRLLPNYAASADDFDFFETRLKATLTQFSAMLDEAVSSQAMPLKAGSTSTHQTHE
ncbi:MAG: aspartate aminotransferase family protein [Thiobacillus sp.]|nr:aspartate aminotransferase family protein [Thiobacillus sp.]